MAIKKLSAEEAKKRRRERALERSFLNQHRKIFQKCGFARLTHVDGIHFEYEGIKSELDDIFVYENVIVFAEYTRSRGKNLGEHAKSKSGIFNAIYPDPYKFMNFFRDHSDGTAEWLDQCTYTGKQLQFRFIYGSNESVEDNHKAFFLSTKFMSSSERSYFKVLTNAVKKSARFELLQYLGVDIGKVGFNGKITSHSPDDKYSAILMPSEQSHFPDGFGVASFYVDPDALLKRSYVLRRNGWRDGLGLYQRLISPAKISAIRAHLKNEKRAFANNIVVTLPDTSIFSRLDGSTVSPNDISEPTPVIVHIPNLPNSIGVIDGQHRIFSYHEDIEPDPEIDKFRIQQNLLATGLVYPKALSSEDREKFEANLFLEINSKQTSASSDVIQAIWVVLDPFKPVSVARVIVNRLAETTPLKGRLERNSLDSGKIKTSSIVSYGLMPLLKRSGSDSIYAIWPDKAAKGRIDSGSKVQKDLEGYLDFSTGAIAKFLNEVRTAVGDTEWRIIEQGNPGILSVTTVNSFLILMRKLIGSGRLSHDYVNYDLSKISGVNFSTYKSSQYADLATYMFSLV